MFTVKIHHQYTVRFSHLTEGKGKRTRRVTVCHIEDERGTVESGRAVCSPQDNFNKATGRKKALAKTLEYFGYGRTARTAFWAAYWAALKKAKSKNANSEVAAG